jgi:hypothetical protein
MEGIYEPNDIFDFKNLFLVKPVVINSNIFFIRYLINETPLYIQPPKCILKQGFIRVGRKMYCDFIFSNENVEFIRWIENLETVSQVKIFENRDKWFETELEMHDIENSFTSPLKIFKSGKFYVLRVNVPCVMGVCNLKIYDEDENEINHENFKENENIMAILEIKGIKCSSRSFQIEFELKQLMLLKPSMLFDKCIFKQNKKNLGIDNDTKDEKNELIDSIVEVDTLENLGALNNIDTIETSEITVPLTEDISSQEISQDLEFLKFNDGNVPPCDEDKPIENISIEYESNEDEEKSDELDMKIQENSTRNESIETDANNEMQQNSLGDVARKSEVVETSDETKMKSREPEIGQHVNNANSENPENILEEINFNLDELSSDDVVHIKNRNDVYFKLYNEALVKARTARDLALSNYLEAKHIKNTFLLQELNKDEELDFLN